MELKALCAIDSSSVASAWGCPWDNNTQVAAGQSPRASTITGWQSGSAIQGLNLASLNPVSPAETVALLLSNKQFHFVSTQKWPWHVVSPLFLRKVHRGCSNTRCRLWDVYLELHLLPVKVQTREGKDIIWVSYFSYFTISHFTIEVFNWLFNCFHLHPQVVVRFNCELVSLPCISFCLECQALLSPPPPPMISQSFFHHSIDCLWMSDRVFLWYP